MKKSKANSLSTNIDNIAYKLYCDNKVNGIITFSSFLYLKKNGKLYNKAYIDFVITNNYEKAYKLLRKQKLIRLNENR